MSAPPKRFTDSSYAAADQGSECSIARLRLIDPRLAAIKAWRESYTLYNTDGDVRLVEAYQRIKRRMEWTNRQEEQLIRSHILPGKTRADGKTQRQCRNYFEHVLQNNGWRVKELIKNIEREIRGGQNDLIRAMAM